MTIEQLLTKLKALEAAARTKHRKHVVAELKIDTDGWITVELLVKYAGYDEMVSGFMAFTPAELETAFTDALAEMGAQ